ncbi:MAG: rod shape-determining protein MreC, partial [Rhodospirillales bacterium]|nr:rod shape-determining protein MreC [Rhodospirillales bacterium]
MTRLATPVKAWSQRFALFFLVCVSVALMLLSKNESIVIEKSRTAVTDAVSPVLEFAARPVATVNEMVDQGRQLVQLAAENTALRQQNERLAHWQTVARQLEAENQSLRGRLSLA